MRPTIFIMTLAYPIYRLASEVNCSGADEQVFSCHCYLVVFHPFVEQLASRLLDVRNYSAQTQRLKHNLRILRFATQSRGQ